MNIYISMKTILNREIICIAWAIDNAEPQVIYRNLRSSEKKFLQSFFAKIFRQLPNNNPTWIGHHIRVALRFMFQRTVTQKIAPPIKLPLIASSWPNAVHDTGKIWSGKSNAISLNALCEILKIERNEIAKQCESRNEFDVWEYLNRNDSETIIATCKENIICCRKIFKQLTFALPSNIQLIKKAK